MPGQINTQFIDLLDQSLMFCHPAPQSAPASGHYNTIKTTEITIPPVPVGQPKKRKPMLVLRCRKRAQ